jgi:hypothetical protein
VRGDLVASLSSARPDDPAGFLADVTGRLRALSIAPWVGLYVRIGEELVRVGIAVESGASADGAALTMPANEDPEHHVPLVIHARAIGEPKTEGVPGLVPIGAADVYALTGMHRALAAVLAGDPHGATAFAVAVRFAAQGALTARPRRLRAALGELEHAVVRATLDPRSAIELLLRLALAGFAGERGAVVVHDPAAQTWTTWASEGDVHVTTAAIGLTELAGEWIATVADAAALAPGAKATYAVARACRSGVLVLVVASAEGARALSPKTGQRVEHAVEAMRLVLDSERAAAEGRAQASRILHVIADVVEAGDADGVGHSALVVEEAAHLGRALGLPAARMAELGCAARLHDVGRVGMVDHAMGTATEFFHPEMGAVLLEAAGEPRAVADLVRVHHERADGMGFPNGETPPEDDLAAWALIAAQAIVAEATRTRVVRDVARRAWLASDGPGVLPVSVVARLVRELA